MDIVDAFQLREVQMTKQEFMAWAENFLAKITDKLTESGKEDRIAGFKKGAADLVKFIVGKYLRDFLGIPFQKNGYSNS